MSNITTRWQEITPAGDGNASRDGLYVFRLASWSHYFDFLEEVVFAPDAGPNRTYIWRGQRRSDWSLSTSLDRIGGTLGILNRDPDAVAHWSDRHLESFIYAARGRRGSSPAELDRNEWWALGQHYGLATPLLDWTRSPFAAAYFAFEERSPDTTEFRVVYGLDQQAIQARNIEIDNGPSIESDRIPVLEFLDPLSDDNPRLVSQGGLFTRSPVGTSIEQWVAEAFSGLNRPVLLRIEIPDGDRAACLRSLDRMNINHVSLFPDLPGASRFCNLRLELEP